MQYPLLSVIIPMFNTEKYIIKCIDSILNQSFKDLEIIIIDDKSYDNSITIVQDFIKVHDNIKLYKAKTKVLAGGARNIGLEKAKGKYISFIDSDDWIDLNVYEKAMDVIQRTESDIAIFGVIKEYIHKTKPYYKYVYTKEEILDENIAFDILTNNSSRNIIISPITCNKIYKSNFLKTYGINFQQNSYNEDDIFTFKCLLMANKVVTVPNVYYHYFQRPDSITHTFSKKHIDDVLYAFQIIKDFLIEHQLYKNHRKNFFAYFERNLSFVLNLLLSKEKDRKTQDKYVDYLVEKAPITINYGDYLNYCGAERLRYFLNPNPIK